MRQYIATGLFGWWLMTGMAGTAGTSASAQTSLAIPPLSGHVVDQINLLTASQQAALDKRLQDYETRTGSQIAVLLVSTTAPEAIEQYSIRVAEAWKLGRKNVDDGVILLVAKDNPKALRRLQIEAGRGVQGSLTDLQSKRILQEVIAPYFQRSDFNGGLTTGVTAITTLLDKEQLPAPPAETAQSTRRVAEQSTDSSIWFALFFFAIAIAIVVSRRSQRGVGLSQNSWGRTAGIIIGNSIGSSIGGQASRSGSGESSGGFSGGGGSFDGGGASGDW